MKSPFPLSARGRQPAAGVPVARSAGHKAAKLGASSASASILNDGHRSSPRLVGGFLPVQIFLQSGQPNRRSLFLAFF